MNLSSLIFSNRVIMALFAFACKRHQGASGPRPQGFVVIKRVQPNETHAHPLDNIVVWGPYRLIDGRD